jgi:hypothetical protein
MSDANADHANGWRRYAKDFLLISAVILALGGLFNLIRPVFPVLAPYVWSTIALLLTAFLILQYVSIWHHSQRLETKTHNFLIVASFLIFYFANEAKSLVYHLKAVNAEGYDKPLTFPLALGFIAIAAVLVFLLLIWLLRFYWDAQVRLNLMQEVLLAKLDVDLSKERRKYFATGPWLVTRTQRLDLLRLIAPDDLSYLKPGPPKLDTN